MRELTNGEYLKLEESIQDFKDYGNILDDLWVVYEAEYYFQKISRSKRMNPERRDNMLGQIEKRLKPILKFLRSSFGQLLGGWLEGHSEEPHVWALNRTEGAIGAFGGNIFQVLGEESGVLYDQLLMQGAHREWVQLQIQLKTQKQTVFTDDIVRFMKTTASHFFLGCLRANYKLLSDVYYPLIKKDVADGNMEQEDAVFMLSQPEHLVQWLYEVSDYSFVNVFQKHFTNAQMEEFVVNVFEKMVYPAWKQYWYGRGLAKTIQTVRNNFELLKGTKLTAPLPQLFVAINVALNTVHKTGSIITYFESEHPEIDTGGLTKKDLTKLSNIDPMILADWDADLKDMGVW